MEAIAQEHSYFYPDIDRPSALFLVDGYKLGPGDAELYSLAYQVGFRPFVVPWFCVAMNQRGTNVYRGFEMLADHAKRPIGEWECISPRLIFHRCDMTSVAEKAFGEIAEANPEALLSYHPELKFLNSQDGVRACLGEHIGRVGDETIIGGQKYHVRLTSFFTFHPAFSAVSTSCSAFSGVALKQPSSGRKPSSSVGDKQKIAVPGIEANESSVTGLLNYLRTLGFGVDQFQQRAGDIIEHMFRCYARWEPLNRSPQYTRLFVVISTQMLLCSQGSEIVPVLVSSGYRPLLHQPDTGQVDQELQGAIRSWLRILFERCREPESIRLPIPDFNRTPLCGERILLADNEVPTEPVVLKDAVLHLNDIRTRNQFAHNIGKRLQHGQALRFYPDDKQLSGCLFTIRQERQNTIMDVAIEGSPDMSLFIHPLASVLPRMYNEEGTIGTRPWPGAQFEYLDPALVGPVILDGQMTREESLRKYLGRVSVKDPEISTDGLGRRYVEPGVGRTCLVDFIRVGGRPDLTDFSVTGVGLTPYSVGGFVELGPEIDGRAALIRATHRKRCSEKLEAAGCRASKVVAIISLPGNEVTMPDGSKSPSVLIIRGFRSVLRVKQLDPVGYFYHSVQHSAYLNSFLIDPRWDPALTKAPTTLEEKSKLQGLATAFEQYGASGDDLRRITSSMPALDGLDDRARKRRLQIIYSYAPILLELVKEKLAVELGRDPETEPLSNYDYVTWFAETLGKQLAIMRKLRFLHDYHHEGVSRYSVRWVHTLVEHNMTLMAEFPDLDTGIFLDCADADMLDELQLTKDDFGVLQAGFERFHLRDVQASKGILQTLASIAFQGDQSSKAQAVSRFLRSYEQHLSRHSDVRAKSKYADPILPIIG